jgi:proline iminopeptidase
MNKENMFAWLFLFLLCFVISCTSKTDKNPENDSFYEEGMVEVEDGVKLFYQRVGDGKQKILVPLGWWMYDDFKHLAKDRDRTFVFYDVRNRARSSSVADSTKLTFSEDMNHIERLRKHFGFEKISLIGESYVGCVVVLYAMNFPDRIENIVQIGSVPYNPRNTFPDSLAYKTSQVDSVKYNELKALVQKDYDLEHPREFAELKWKIMDRINLVGDSSYSSRMGKQWGEHFQYDNELPHNFNRHLRSHYASFLAMEILPEDIKKVKARVLTIAGTKDRNVPYGASRQWASLLPNARFIRVDGAGHIPWVENPDLVFGSIDLFLEGEWHWKAIKLSE